MKPISRSASLVSPSATLFIDSLVNQMRAEGVDVVGFGAGEPDFNTPDHIKVAGIKAVTENRTRYTPPTGVGHLKKAICKHLLEKAGLVYKPNQICVTSGAKHNVYIALQSILNPGDEVVLPAPYWVSYIESIRLCAGVPKIIETTEETKFKISAEMLEDAITEKTKCLILTNPSNPTGMCYTKEELTKLAEVIVKHDLYILSDEIYDAFTYTGDHIYTATLSDDIKERTIFVNGVSKAYAMTGWRIGYAASDEEIAAAMGNYISHSTGSPSTISQYASIAAIASTPQYALDEMKSAFDERRKYFVSRVNGMEGVSCLEPEGAFYVFMNIKEQIGRTIFGQKITGSSDFAECLLKNGLVAVVPGIAFGADGYLRWSYATSMENIEKGLDRFEKFLKG